ncbi:MAG: AAA family ATPase [Verrucomicrobiota bacterium]
MTLTPYDNKFQNIWTMLARAKKSKRLSHAYLIIGDDLEILNAFSFKLAAHCTCISPHEDGKACGKCKICREIAEHSYPELQTLYPASKSRQIVVNDVRDFEHLIHLATPPERPKVGIIFDADRMNNQAQNAFLKTLEEPPDDVTLILVTSYPKNLLPTIRSRCQTISLLTNKQSYSQDLAESVIPLIENLKNDSGSAVALATAQGIKELLKSLFKNLEEEALAADSQSEQYEQELSKTARKQLEDMRAAQLNAEYLQKRQEVVNMIQTWFHQKHLLAYGVDDENIPNPELFNFASNSRASQLPPSKTEADQQLKIVD